MKVVNKKSCFRKALENIQEYTEPVAGEFAETINKIAKEGLEGKDTDIIKNFPYKK